jgi:ABC-type transport system substrate-binding protein
MKERRMKNEEPRMKNEDSSAGNHQPPALHCSFSVLRSPFSVPHSSFFILRSSFFILFLANLRPRLSTAHSPFSVLRSPFFILHPAFFIVLFSSPGISQQTPSTIISKILGQPADALQLTNGETLHVIPLAKFPGSPPTISGTLSCELRDKPGSIVNVTGADIRSIQYFEIEALKRIDGTLQSRNHATLETADKLLQELARFHESRRSHPPLAVDPWSELRGRILAKLHEVRDQRLALFTKTAATVTDWTEALRLADTWLSLDGSLRGPIRALWLRYGMAKLEESNFTAVRATLDQIDNHFLESPETGPLCVALRNRAEALAKEAKTLPADQASGKLQEALTLWPHGAGWRDELDKLNQNYRVLNVAVRRLPEYLSPATAWTNAENQALNLLFSRLVQARFDEPPGQQYEPDLVAELPRADGIRRNIRLRRDAYWSDGERLTTADVRHTAQLLERTSTWRDLIEPPRYEGRPFSLSFTLRHGLLDPLAPLRFHVLPQRFQNRPLTRADDPEFAKAPVGSGPFRYVGQKQEGKRTVAVFQTNPCFTSQAKNRGNVRAIHMMAWDPSQTDAPLPHLVLDAPARSLDALKRLGYANVSSTPCRRVYFLAVNHRLPAMANQDLRRALAHAIPREQILQDYFRGPSESPTGILPLSGPFPAQCWAACPPPRVPADPYQPELAKSLAKKAGPGPFRLFLKFPADEPGVREASAAIARETAKLFEQVQLNLTIELIPLSSRQMHAAIASRDFELAYHHWDFPDDNFWLWPVFDPHPDALRAGGSNFLGYDNDAELQSLLRAAMSHRYFPTVRERQQSVHYHIYERMPLIPLWQLPQSVAIHPSLAAGHIDPERAFADVLQWKVSP